MQHFTINWDRYAAYAATWKKLSLESRRRFLAIKSGDHATALPFGSELELLVHERLLTPGADGLHVRVDDDAREFSRAVRAMFRHAIFAAPSDDKLLAYLHDNFMYYEIQSLERICGVRFNPSEVVRQVRSEQWLRGFMAGDSKDLQQFGSRNRTRSSKYSAGKDAKEARALLNVAMRWTGPVPLCELPSLLADLSTDQLNRAVDFCVSSLRLFAGMDANLSPVIGLWPEICARLHRPKALPPAEMSPRETSRIAFRLEDMTAMLVRICEQAIPYRANDGEIFEKFRARIIADLPALPEWIDRFDGAIRVGRIADARRLLNDMKLVRHGVRSNARRIEPTGMAESWLAQSPAARLRSTLDHLKPTQRPPNRFDYFARANPQIKLSDALLVAFRSVSDQRFVAWEEFLRWRCQSANPFIEMASVTKARIQFDWSGSTPTPEELEYQWQQYLIAYFAEILLPLGGVEVGICADDALCFMLTDLGRYIIGLADDFQYGQSAADNDAVVVQPNFDVVFLQPSPLAEAIIARFAERKRSGLGALFKITKASIVKAAGNGITVERIVDTLKGVSAKALPANVEREITSWIAGCRRIHIKNTVLIRCPDPQTAARVVAASGKAASLLTDTVVELHDAKTKPNLLKKLKFEGIFEGGKSTNTDSDDVEP